jgi:hypothetical protein
MKIETEITDKLISKISEYVKINKLNKDIEKIQSK